MKVLFWTDGFWPLIGGVETQGLKFIECMQERGHQYKVVAQRNYPSLKEDETYNGISIKRFDFGEIIKKRDLSVIRPIHDHVESLMREFQPDIIHLNVYIGWGLFVFLLLRSAFRGPIVLTVHAPILYEGKIPPISARIVAMADQLCCVSNWVFSEMQKLVPMFSNKLRLIPNGLSIPEIDPSPLSFSPPTLLLLGRLSHEKEFDVGIQAFCLLKKGGSNARLLIAGEGDERQKLENLVSELGLRDSVEFTGKLARDEVPFLINRVTLVLVPSSYESFGLVALEAMQMQRPVIASDIGGLREVVSAGETGMLIPIKDPIALAQAIQFLLDHPEEAIQMGVRGRKRAMEKFTLQQNVVQYEDVYTELTQSPKFNGSDL